MAGWLVLAWLGFAHIYTHTYTCSKSLAFLQPAEEGGEENEEKKKQLLAVMKYVLRDEGEYGDAGGMVGDVFVELLDMVVPKWDKSRGGGDGDDEDEDEDSGDGAAAAADGGGKTERD